jgi:hypothetical protein
LGKELKLKRFHEEKTGRERRAIGKKECYVTCGERDVLIFFSGGLSQITLRLFDNRTLPNDDKNKYRCEISFSPGVFNDPTVEAEHQGEITPPLILNKNIPCDDVIAFLIAATDDNKTPEEGSVKEPEVCCEGGAGEGADAGDILTTPTPSTVEATEGAF